MSTASDLKKLIQELVAAEVAKSNAAGQTYYGNVKAIDDNGTAWVLVDGSTESADADTSIAKGWTPCTVANSAKAGDRVQVTIRNHQAVLTDNLTSPSTDDTAANAAQETADATALKFFVDALGVHIATTDGDATTGSNLLFTAASIAFRKALEMLMELSTDSYVVDGETIDVELISFQEATAFLRFLQYQNSHAGSLSLQANVYDASTARYVGQEVHLGLWDGSTNDEYNDGVGIVYDPPIYNAQGQITTPASTHAILEASDANVRGNQWSIPVGTLLWDGALWPAAAHTCPYKYNGDPVSMAQCHSGILLVWSQYSGTAALDYGWTTTFIPKKQIIYSPGGGMFCPVAKGASGSQVMASKYVYVNEYSIAGHDWNSNASVTVNGYTTNMQKWVLRKVISV